MEPRPDHRFDPFSFDAAGLDGGLDDDFLDGLDYSDPAAIGKLLGIPPPPQKPPNEIRLEVKQRCEGIFASHYELRTILERHEATIQKRWSKKKKQQRLEVLAASWGPGMPAMHRPDFEAFRRETDQQRKAGSTKYRDYFMWPYINEEDLAKPKSLPLLLNARGRHHPSHFAGADFDEMNLGRVSHGVTPLFLNGYVMIMFVDECDKTNYGKLLAWDEHPDGFEWFHTRKQAQPGEGLLILEAQERTLDFLVKCCKAILHDIPADTLTADTFPLLPEPQLKSEREVDGFESLAAMAAEAPYRVPVRLDLKRIEALLRARVSAAEDHLWALREDPGYFAEQLADLKEHRQEMIKDSNGGTHPTLRPGKQDIFWARIIGNAVLQAYLELEMFAQLHEQAAALLPIYARHAAKLSPARDLPEELLAPLLRFRHYLNQAAKGPLGILRQSVTASPPWRKFYAREPPVDMASTKMLIRSKPGAKMSKVQEQLTWLLRALWEDGRDLFLIGMPLALDELERLIQTEPEASEQLTAYVAGTVGTLSIISQCLGQIERFQPWSRSFENTLVNMEDDLKADYASSTRPMANVMAALRDKNLIRAAKLGDLSDKKFGYPSDKRRTKENTDLMRQAEENLDKFWAHVDYLIYNSCGDLARTAVGRLLSRERSLQRTPEWIDKPTVTTKKRDPQRPTASDGDIASIYKPLSTLYFELPGKGDESKPELPPKSKLKTRGSALEKQEDPRQLPIDETALTDVPSIPVGARDLKVFKTLFFDPNMSSHPGEMPWNDFLHAMTSTGLFTAEKLYGSVWQFQRVSGPDQSRIQFHEPHPHGKIPFVLARRIGRRLNKHYGWVRETFVLKDK